MDHRQLAVDLVARASAEFDKHINKNPDDHLSVAMGATAMATVHALIAIATPAGDPHVCGARRDHGEHLTFPCILLPGHPALHSDRDGGDW